MPHHWEPPLQVKETGLLSQCLVTIRDWLADNPPSAARYFRRAPTARRCTLGSPEDGAIRAFAILEVTGASSEQHTLAVAQILSRVPVAVFLARVDLVVKVLRRAATMGKDAREDVFRTLLPTSGLVVTSWSGAISQDTDVAERDRGAAHRH